MKRPRAAWLVFVAWLAAAVAFQSAASQTVFPSDATIRAMAARDLAPNDSVGIVIGLLDADGTRRVVTVGPTAYDGGTLFEIGSITKTFTGILLAEMAGRGETRLDEPVAALLPEGVRVPERGGRSITLLDLSTHSSALPRMPNNFRPADRTNPYADYTTDQLYAFLGSVELTRDIGADFEYSNVGVGLLGHALERRAGTPYEALVTERVLEPLGMTSTVVTLGDAHRARLAPGHSSGGTRVSSWDIATLTGAGALRSTADDMLSYLAANIDPPASPLGEAIRQSHEPRYTVVEDVTTIGLNWIRSARDAGTMVWHNGGTGGYRAFAGFDPHRRIGVVVLTNSQRSADAIGMHLLDARLPLAGSYERTRYWVLVLVVSVMLVAGVIVAWRRTGRKGPVEHTAPNAPTRPALVGALRGPRGALGAAMLAVLGVVAWIGAFAWLLLGSGVDMGAWPVRLIVAFVVPLGVAVLLGISRVGSRLAAGLPVAALVAAQAFRLPLDIVMHRPFTFGASAGVSFGGWNIDILTGASAIVLAVLVAVGIAGARVVRVWNIIGAVLLLDLALVLWLNDWIAQSELVLLPGLLLAFGAFGHVVLYRRVGAREVLAAGEAGVRRAELVGAG